jgi:DtxR family Mn-dependent transcriptional regulator
MSSNKKFHTVRGYQLLDDDRLLTPAMEDYLEMIYRKSLEVGSMRINTLSELLNVHPSSSTKMAQKLVKAGMIEYEKYGIIFLTDKGKKIGEYLYNRHNTIENFLECIGISENAFMETELIEHHIGAQTIQNIHLFNCFIRENPVFRERFEQFKSSAK